jgi:DNA-binding transcriptional LysR family regulator
MDLPDLKLLQTAIVLSEVRNYSRAAKQLGIQQPALTKRINELEEFVGFKLFIRTTQFVEPTDSCRELVKEARSSVFHAEWAIQVAKATEQGAQAVLHIGKSQYLDPYLLSMLNSVSLPLHPNVKVVLTTMTYARLEQEVLMGRLDIAVVSGGSDNPAITQIELSRSPFYLLMSDQCPLAAEFELKMSQLGGLRWALFDRIVNFRLFDTIMQVAESQGGTPASLQHVATAEEAAQVIYSEMSDVAFLTRAGAWRVARNGLAMRLSRKAGSRLSRP